MSKYFGTDGIRGKANVELDARKAFLVGSYLGYWFSRNGRQKIVIGKDTRLSSDMLENALASGIAAYGCDAYLVGYCPTPVISYLTRTKDFACGAMISASHNPYYDNGIKIFSVEGIKMSSDVEDQIEEYIDGKVSLEYKTGDAIGRVIRYEEGLEDYIDWITKEYPIDLTGMKIAMDCANGAACYTAERTLKRLGAECTAVNNTPDGLNINTKCGSTHPEAFCEFMKNGSFDIGLTFDGDADRQIMVTPQGELVNGDFMLYICGIYYRNKGVLTNNTVVTTVMANLGLFKAMQREGIEVVQTAVGDKYVYEEMAKNNDVVGGEQSGHIIFLRHAVTGDGLMTALAMLKIITDTGKTINELMEGLRIYPQLLVNVKVTDKNAVLKDDEINDLIKEVTESLNGNGRILVRPSGTEPLLRVMAEAETDEICADVVNRIADRIREKYGA